MEMKSNVQDIKQKHRDGIINFAKPLEEFKKVYEVSKNQNDGINELAKDAIEKYNYLIGALKCHLIYLDAYDEINVVVLNDINKYTDEAIEAHKKLIDKIDEVSGSI